MTKSKPITALADCSQSATPCLPVPKPRSLNAYLHESQLLLWIWRVISEISCIDYEQYLRDGVILCQLIESISPDAFGDEPRPTTGGEHKRTKQDNIQRFLDSCRAFGLTADQLFEVEDLLSMQDIPRVTKCLFTLGKLAAEKSGKPELGKPYDEWLDEQLTGPVGENGSSRHTGMPIGDDLYVSHVNTTWLKDRLEQRRAAAASRAAIKRPPKEPLLQRTPSKPLSDLKAIFVATRTSPIKTGPNPQINLFAR